MIHLQDFSSLRMDLWGVTTRDSKNDQFSYGCRVKGKIFNFNLIIYLTFFIFWLWLGVLKIQENPCCSAYCPGYIVFIAYTTHHKSHEPESPITALLCR